MVNQGQLFIGEPVHSLEETATIFQNLGVPKKNLFKRNQKTPDFGLLCEAHANLLVQYKRKSYPVEVSFICDTYKSNVFDKNPPQFPIPLIDPNTWAFVGFALTGRYHPEIIDQGICPFILTESLLTAIEKAIEQKSPEMQEKYRKALIQKEQKEHNPGRPEPFVLDLESIQDILSQVRKVWKTAQVLLYEDSY
jgi:hypothetical protein